MSRGRVSMFLSIITTKAMRKTRVYAANLWTTDTVEDELGMELYTHYVLTSTLEEKI
jgi:hypothetical protein